MSTRAPRSLAKNSKLTYLHRVKSHPYAFGAAAAVATLTACALVNHYLAEKAVQKNPPIGKFVEIDGVRLHYIERGEGQALVLIHGNGSMIQDFECSGLIEMAAKNYRVIVFDRPGYGHSERPRGTIWSPDAQAALLHAALMRIGVPRATVFGHSWGTSVAVALALKYPELVASLVLASGYYYPTARADVVALSGPAVPVIGDLMSLTLAPLISRAMWPFSLGTMFSPKPVPAKFKGFPKEMALRPSQIRASAGESALMIPDAFAFRGDYGSLKMPVVIIAGDEDQLIDVQQSARLYRQIAQSTFHRILGAGHMVHQTETNRVMSAINEASSKIGQAPTEGLPSAA
jgi:pimeloyl-ACP methyl ester carboxylesterase